MKVKLNPMFEQVSGQLGEMVFRELRGQTIASRKPTVTGEPTAGQIAHRQLFRQAAAYGKTVMANSSLRALYEEVAKSRNMPVFALTIADYFNEPTIETVDLANYQGQIGDLIHVVTMDDLGVVSVNVALYDNQNNLLESGDAIETSLGAGRWTYTAKSVVASGTVVSVQVVATDRPGGQALDRRTISL